MITLQISICTANLRCFQLNMCSHACFSEHVPWLIALSTQTFLYNVSTKKAQGVVMIRFFQQFVNKVLRDIFKKKKKFKLGLYGPPNGGKTTLANRICADWLGKGEVLGTTSAIAHETRSVQMKEAVIIKSKDGKKEIEFTVVDTPGIATKIDYEDFLKQGLKEDEAKVRAKEATQGVIESIQWLDNMDCVLVVLDASIDPFSQVNITIIGNLAARKIPVLIVANKIDLKKANISRIEAAFPQYNVVGISAKKGEHMEQFYEALFALVG